MTDLNANIADLYQLRDADPGFLGMDPNGHTMHEGNYAMGNGQVLNSFDDLQLNEKRLGGKKATWGY